MHICIVTPFFYPLLNGVSVRVYKDAKTFIDEGHKVSIVSPHEGIEEFDCYKIGRPTVFLSPTIIIKLLLLHKKKNIDVIISHSYISDFFVYFSAKLIGAKFIRQFHGPEKIEIKETTQGVIKKILRLFGCFLDRCIVKKADKIIVVEKELSEWLNKEYQINKNKIIFVANYPDLAEFKPTNNKNQKFTVGYLGTLQRGRIKPLLELSNKLTNLSFLVVGSGDDEKEVKRYKNIKLITEKNYKKIPYIISQFDLGIVFSLLPQGMAYKGPPMKLFEYLACEIPVVAINLWELKDIIEKNKVGIIVDKDNLNNGIQQILNNYQKFKENAKKFRVKMIRYYNWQIEKEKLLNLIRLYS